MNWSDINMWAYGLVTGLVGGIIYLIRTVFTNQTEITLLKQLINSQDDYRKERDLKLDHQLVEIRSDIKSLVRFNNDQ